MVAGFQIDDQESGDSALKDILKRFPTVTATNGFQESVKKVKKSKVM
jgi:hypothetical protein